MVDTPGAILFAYYYYPANTSGVQRAARLAKYLPENGFRMQVITTSEEGVCAGMPGVHHVPDSPAGWTSGEWRHRASRLAQRIVPYNEQLLWVPHAVEAASRIVAREGDVRSILSTSPPVGSHLAAYWTKRRYPQLRWVADFRDPILGNPNRARQWARPYDAALERLIFSCADVVIAVSDAFVETWKKNHPAMAHKFHVIWNGFDPEDAFGPKTIPARSRRVLLHAGVLYRQRHPKAMLAALDRLIEGGRLNPDDILVRFLGHLQGAEELTAMPFVKRLTQRGCLELDGKSVPRPEAMDQIATADWLFLIDILSLDGAGYTVPAKIFDYLLTGRPVLAITDRDAPVDMILESCGIPSVRLYHSEPEEETEAKLLRLFSLPSEPVKPSQWFVERFDGREQAKAVAGHLRWPAAGGQR